MKKILVVEDDPVNATMLFDYLTSKGYDVAIVMNGEDAVTKFPVLQPDLMIVDLQLPKKNGFNVCLEISRMNPNATPYLVMSAVFNDETAEAFAVNDLKAAGFLRKPFKLNDLYENVARILERQDH